MSQPPLTTEQMRIAITRRVRDWAQHKPVVLHAEYFVRADDEHRFRRVMEPIVEAIRNAHGHRHVNWFRQNRQSRADVVEFVSFEEWDTPAAFLAHWSSERLRRWQTDLRELQASPARIAVLASAGDSVDAPATGKVQVPRTGQIRSWDEHGDLTALRGTDGDVRAGATYSGVQRFVDNADGTVTDTLTDLIWLKNANPYGEVAWEEALARSNDLASGMAGLSDGSRRGDWRLPNVNEMESILSLDSSFGPAIDKDSPFYNLEASNYWTSSSVAMAPALGWFVALAVGPPVFDLKVNLMRMWPVRGTRSRVAETGQTQCFDLWGRVVPCAGTGQDPARKFGVEWPRQRFTSHGNGAVTDELTGLVWLQDPSAIGRHPWQAAIDICNGLKAGGAHARGLSDDSKEGDWRLPNLNELRSLVDYSQSAPALPAGHPFTGIESSLYWSSTTVASAPRFARFVFMGLGPSVWDHKSVRLNVWPVRNHA